MICSGKPCTANTCCKASIVLTLLLVLISLTSENASTNTRKNLFKNGATFDALTQPHTLLLIPYLLDHIDENEKFSYHNRFWLIVIVKVVERSTNDFSCGLVGAKWSHKKSKFFIPTTDSKNGYLLVLSNTVRGKEKLNSFKVCQNLLFGLKLVYLFNSGHHRFYPHH